MRRRRAERPGTWLARWGGQWQLLVAIGVASLVSAGVLRATGVGVTYGAVDVWFVIIGIFFIAVGVAALLGGRGGPHTP